MVGVLLNLCVRPRAGPQHGTKKRAVSGPAGRSRGLMTCLMQYISRQEQGGLSMGAASSWAQHRRTMWPPVLPTASGSIQVKEQQR